MTLPRSHAPALTGYQRLIVALLAFLQFTIILDFMVLAPLGAIIMPALKVPPAGFGSLVSVYAFSAGAAGLLAAGFSDRFDRKKLLLFFILALLSARCCVRWPTPMIPADRPNRYWSVWRRHWIHCLCDHD